MSLLLKVAEAHCKRRASSALLALLAPTCAGTEVAVNCWLLRGLKLVVGGT